MDAINEIIQPMEGETMAQFQAFLCFCSLAYTERQLEKVAKETGFSFNSVKMWSAQHKWIERAMRVDAHRWTEEFKRKQELTQEDNKKYILANRRVKDKTLALNEKLLGVLEKMVDKASKADEVQILDYVETKDGRVVPQTMQVITSFKFSDIPRTLDTIVKTARALNDLPLEEKPQLPAFDADPKELTYEELVAAREENLKHIHLLEAGSKLS